MSASSTWLSSSGDDFPRSPISSNYVNAPIMPLDPKGILPGYRDVSPDGAEQLLTRMPTNTYVVHPACGATRGHATLSIKNSCGCIRHYPCELSESSVYSVLDRHGHQKAVSLDVRHKKLTHKRIRELVQASNSRLTRETATEVLAGKDKGTFVIRPSSEGENVFSITYVNANDEIDHHRIEIRDGLLHHGIHSYGSLNNFLLAQRKTLVTPLEMRLGETLYSAFVGFDTAESSNASYVEELQADEPDGPAPESLLEMNREEANKRLSSFQPGTYLLRKSSYGNCWAVSIRSGTSTEHYVFTRVTGGYQQAVGKAGSSQGTPHPKRKPHKTIEGLLQELVPGVAVHSLLESEAARVEEQHRSIRMHPSYHAPEVSDEAVLDGHPTGAWFLRENSSGEGYTLVIRKADDELEKIAISVSDRGLLVTESREYVSLGALKRDFSIRSAKAVCGRTRGLDHTNHSKEFTKICRDSVELSPDNASAAMSATHKGKNRYPDVMPFDANRFTIPVLSDWYINASVVSLPDHPQKYVVSQGPTETTVIDHWQMLWASEAQVAVMLTDLQEGSKQKCAQYWPNLGETKTYALYEVECKEEQTVAAVGTAKLVRREFRVKGFGPERTLVQFHFQGWKDYNTTSEGLLSQLVDEVRKAQGDSEKPIQVHCSAGIGRTGTFLAVKHIADQIDLEDKSAVSVPTTVAALRSEETGREGMVQTRAQYASIYSTLQQRYADS